MTRAAIYTRISKDFDGTGLGVERQAGECRELCARDGLEVVSTFTDNDISAFKARRRPGYEAMKEAMRAGDVDTIVVWHPDRLTRQTRELEDLIDLLDATNIEVVTVTAGKLDLRTPSGRMVARMVGSVAKYESEHKSERQKSKNDELARSGRPPGGRAPYGYRWEHPDATRGKGRLLLNDAEAATVRWMADQVLAGESTVAVQRMLNDKGIPTKQGQPWHHSTVRAVLVNPVIAALRVHRREIAGPGNWEPILDRETWERVVATVADPARKRKRTSHKFMLSGLVHSITDDQMNGSRDINGRRIYTTRTPATTPTQIGAEPLEDLVTELVLLALKDWKPEPAATSEPGEVERLEAELAELAKLRGEQIISMAEWLAAREPLTAALNEARVTARRTPTPVIAGGDIREQWDTASSDQRRQIIATIVEKITIKKATRGRWSTLEERVMISWRH